MATTDFIGGSVWRKWDLHIHSPLSLLSNEFPYLPDGTPDWEAYTSALESLDMAVVGITDYFTIDGFKKIKEVKEAGRVENISTLLPNIEFRLSNVLASKKDGDKPRRLNFHVIFSDQVETREIEEHFLHDIDFYYEGAPQSSDRKRKLKVSNIEALGKKLLSENLKLREIGLTPAVVGAQATVVNHEQITEILTKGDRFKDGYLLILPEELSNLIEWGGQDHIIRQGLMQKSDMVFSSNIRTAAWCVGLNPYLEGVHAFVREFKSMKPCIHGSDAHKIAQMGKPCSKRSVPTHDCSTQPGDCEMRYCWIKADPTFEGLRQLKFEPTDRVKIQQSNPTPLKSNSCISGVRIDGARINDELSLEQTNFPLNNGLVAVTGGKGAGKTALVDLIANLFTDRCNSKDSNSFVRRIVRDNASLNVAITLADGVLFEKSLSEPRFVEQSDLVYIAQGELEDYIGENSDLNKYIRDLIFESTEVKNTVKAFEFEKVARRINEIETEIAERNRTIEKLEGQTSEKVLSGGKREKAQIEAESRDVESKIPALESKLTKEKLEIVEQKQATQSNLQERKRDLIEVGELLANSKQFVSEDVSRFNLYVAKINKLLRDLDIEGQIPVLEYDGLDGLTEVGVKVEGELSKVVAAIEASEKDLRGYEAEMQEHARYLGRRNELATRLADLTKKLDDITESVKQLEHSRKERNDSFAELLRTILEQQQKYAEIIGAFGSQKAEVLSDLDFKPNIQFARKLILDGLEEVLDNRQIEVFGTVDTPSLFSVLQELYTQLASGDATAADRLVSETARLAEEMKSKMKRSQAISVGSLYRCLYKTYLSVVPIVSYKNTAINKLSLGQKATVLIKIYLAQGRNPIVIDSHDDHLDNEFIMDELVGAIRKAKSYRQVILASNNGNVVINSDAEQIIIAQRQQGKITYLCGSIENPVIRDRALKVLEGGEDAFKKRQEKYRVES